MYLQALICSVGLKYYKHVMFSDPGHLLFKVAFFLLISFECILFVRLRLFDSSVDWHCIASWMHTSTSHEAYVHINEEQAKAEGHTSRLLGDNLLTSNVIHGQR